jgi:TonB family protein
MMKTAALAFVLAVQTAGVFTPARAVRASAPAQPPAALGGGEVVLGVTVDETGRVASVRIVRATPPFTELVRQELGSWRFTPAETSPPGSAARRVSSDVLVAAVFRPPMLYDLPNSGSAAAGPAPRSGADGMPNPIAMIQPLFPPNALFDGVVVVEAAITAQGDVSAASVMTGGSGFAAAALDAARKWRFQPAMQDGRPVAAYAYLIFGFRQPVTGPGR